MPKRGIEVNSESSSVSSKPRNLSVFLIGVLLGAVVAGIGAFVFVSGSSDVTAPSGPAHTDTEQVKGVSSSLESLDKISDSEGLQRSLQDLSILGRAIVLHRVTSGEPKQELNRLFALAEDVRPRRLRDEIQSAVVRRLAQIDPENTLVKLDAYAEVRRNRLISEVFQEWSVASLEESVEFAKGMRELDRTAALEGILRSRIDLSDSESRTIAVQLGNEQYLLDYWARAGSHDVIESPLAAWNEFATFHGTDVDKLSPDQRSLLARIALSWSSRDGFGEMLQAMSALLGDYDGSVAVLGLLFDEVVADDPRIAMGAAAVMSPEVRSIVMNALGNLAEADPQRALEIAAAMEAGGSKQVLQRSVISAWMEADPKAVLDARTSMPDDFQDWIEQSSLMSMVRSVPEEVPPYIRSIKNETAKEIVTINLSLNWARKDPMAVFEWLQSAPEVHKWYSRILTDVIVNLAERDPEEAMRFALEQPPREYDGIGRESSVVAHVAWSDIDAAVAMTDRARDEKTRDYMMVSIGTVLVNQRQYKKAMEWASNLKETQREEHFERVVLSWASGNPEQLYEEMDNLPSDKLREQAAEMLIDFNEFKKAFNADQIDELKKYLPE